jgi:hypothetical protein
LLSILSQLLQEKLGTGGALKRAALQVRLSILSQLLPRLLLAAPF